VARSYCVIFVPADVPCEQGEKSAKFSSVARNFCLGVPKIYYVFTTFYMKPQHWVIPTTSADLWKSHKSLNPVVAGESGHLDSLAIEDYA